MGKIKPLLVIVAVVILGLCVWYGYQLLFPTHVDTSIVNEEVVKLKQSLADKEEELKQMNKTSVEKQIIIRQTVKEEIKKLPPDSIAKGILDELSKEED